MNRTTRFVLASCAFLFSAPLFASSCEIHYTRTACPGQEAISYKKCDGQQSCSETEDAASVGECKKAAMAGCENKRLNVTKSKVVFAKFEGEPIKSDAGDDDFCKSYPKRAAEFDQCGK